MGKTIAIASGKGGTGKTTFAVNLASIIDKPMTLIDCDVEEPNCHLFLKTEAEEVSPFAVPIPKFDSDLCTGCGKCAKVCRYNAILLVADKPMLFPEICHSCGGCQRVCPSGAISEVPMPIGEIHSAVWKENRFVYGQLDIGQARSSPIIGHLRETFSEAELTLIDSPPGTSCSAVEAVRGVDLVVLVTEPTPFGLNDLKLAVQMVKKMGLKQAVVINRSDLGGQNVEEYCREVDVPVIGKFPFDRKVAESYSRGLIVVEHVPEFRQRCEDIWGKIMEIVQ